MSTKKERAAARKVQEEVVLGITRRCRGPHLVAEGEQRERFDRWYEIEKAGKEKPARTMIAELVEAANELAPFEVVARHAEKGDWEGLRRAAFPLIRLRGDAVGHGCGWDLNEEILKHPFDGEDHETECPNCGVSMGWTAPVFPE